jgi:hypothetical protein
VAKDPQHAARIRRQRARKAKMEELTRAGMSAEEAKAQVEVLFPEIARRQPGRPRKNPTPGAAGGPGIQAGGGTKPAPAHKPSARAAQPVAVASGPALRLTSPAIKLDFRQAIEAGRYIGRFELMVQGDARAGRGLLEWVLRREPALRFFRAWLAQSHLAVQFDHWWRRNVG